MESHESELTSSSSSVYKERKSASCRPTAFTVFCREYCQDHSGFNPAKWKSEWELKSADEKKSYAEKAKMQLLQNNPKTIRKLLANLEWTHKELDRLGLPSFSLVSNPSTDTIFSVVFGKAKNFINEYEVEKNFGNFVSRRSFNNPNQVPADTGHLRKQVRGHMQNLYKSATGKTGKFPYSKVKTGEVIVDGAPTEVLPLQPPSHYGIHKLNVLLSIKSISIRKWKLLC